MELPVTPKKETKINNYLSEENASQRKIDKIMALRRKGPDGTFKVHNKTVQYAPRAFYVISSNNIIRRNVVWLIEWQQDHILIIRWFEYFILFAIACNSFCLAAYDYQELPENQNLNDILNLMGDIFTIIFLVEALLKMFAMGFVVHKKAYLREGWNVLDFLIVLFGVFTFVSTSLNLRALRTLRAFRPLKSINAIPSMRKQVQTLISSLPELFNVTIFLLFIFILFSILGLQQFVGEFYGACRLTETPVNATYWPKVDQSLDRPCNIKGLGNYDCPSGTWCGHPNTYGFDIKYDRVQHNEKIMFGITTFDNFGTSLLAVIQIITTDGWTQIMYALIDGSNQYFATFYCCLLILLGSFFLLNLILAVIMQAYAVIQQKELEYDIAENIRAEEIQRLEQERRDRVKKASRPKKVKLLDQIENSADIDGQSVFSKNKSRLGMMEKIIEFQIQKQKRNKAKEKEREKRKRRKEKKLMKMERERQIKKLLKKAEKSSTKKVQSMRKKMSQIEDTKKKDVYDILGTAFKKQKTQRIKIDEDQDQAENFMLRYEQAEAIVDLGQRIKAQQQIRIENEALLKKMELAMRQRFLDTKRNQYGLDNEEELIAILKKSIKARIEDGMIGVVKNEATGKNELNRHDEGWIEMFMSLQNELKENHLKRHVFNKIFLRFKQLLKLKQRLARVMIDAEVKIQFHNLDKRAQNNYVFKGCLWLTRSTFFSPSISFVIILNTIVLAMDKHPIEEETINFFENMNLIFSSIFFLEMLLKLLALGIRNYIKDAFNIFDSVVVIVSTVDIAVTFLIYGQDSGSNSAISALRAFRLLRIFKLAKTWKDFQELLKTIANTLKDISNFSVLLLIFMFTYTLLGLEVFSGQVKFNDRNEPDLINGTSPPSNFDNFLHGITSVFIVLANDGWTVIFFDHYRAVGKVLPTFYFLSLLIIGNYILLKLFLSILLKNFDETSINREIEQEIKKKHSKWSRLINMMKKLCRIKQTQNQVIPDVAPGYVPAHLQSHPTQHQEEEEDYSSSDDEDYNRSLFIFGEDNKIREFIKKIVQNPKFDMFIIVFIVLSSIQLALENPLNDPNGKFVSVLNHIDIVFTSIFACEALLKIISQGFLLNGPDSYLRSSQNILDFLVVTFSIASLTVTDVDLSVFKILRMLRVLRPVRVISKNQGLKLSINSLFNAIPSIANVILITGLFFVIFAIIGVNYLKGQLFYCYPPPTNTEFIAEGITKWTCLNNGGYWQKYIQSYDNIFEGVLTMFTMATLTGWSESMYRGIDAGGVDRHPIVGNSGHFAIFFIIFIIFASFFMLNLFVGVIISTYNREKEKQGKNFLLTKEQQKWLENKLLVIQSKPIAKLKSPESRFRRFFFLVASKPVFDHVILIFIFVNTIVLALTWYRQAPTVDFITEIINYIFAALFTFEAIIKIIAFDKKYFKDSWNVFDLLIVIGTLLGTLIQAVTNISVGTSTTIIRSFRIGRMFRLFKRNKSLKIIFQTFIVTIPAIVNVGSLMLLFMYIYSVAGVFLFAEVKLAEPLNEIVNFQNVGSTLITLTRITTGEGWHKLMFACSRQPSIFYECIQSPSYQDYANNGYQTIGCGFQSSALIFFLTFIVLISLIFINLFVAIILQAFEDTSEKDRQLFNQETTDNFREVWSEFDPNATSFIDAQDYPNLMLNLGEPLGWDNTFVNNIPKQDQFIKLMDLPTNANNQLQFLDVLENLALLLIVDKEIKNYESILLNEEEETKEKVKPTVQKKESRDSMANIGFEGEEWEPVNAPIPSHHRNNDEHMELTAHKKKRPKEERKE